MPKVLIRKRVGRRSGGWRYRLSRWHYRNSSRNIVVGIFVVVTLASVAVASAINGVAGGRQKSTVQVVPVVPPH